jgi:hypothetical protein
VPHIQMRDAVGMNYQITTKSRELLQAWFDEWLPQLYPADLEPEYGDPVIMSIYPLPLAPSGNEFDWITDSRKLGQQFTIPRDPAKALDALDRQRRFLEAHE